ncbi:MAG TPA: DUF1697 domain-containing protein [Acidimicrobiales bacterium]|nr:DUF1697 domain-containing protein [Acidimicrobiales bacterium]
MPTYVALLRSVNVAGHGRLAMADLQRSFREIGHADVSTYIQTGNVIFRSASRSASRLTTDIEEQLRVDFGQSPAVIIRTADEMVRIAATSPYAKTGADAARHHVTFLAAAPSKSVLAAFRPPPSGRDVLTIVGREVYVHTPDGYGNTKLNGSLLERRLHVVSTTRNWNTVRTLGELLGG